MSQQLINHNADLKKLRNHGYNVVICDGHLVAHHIPYVNHNKEVKLGTLVTSLDMSGNSTAKPSTHVIQFCGDHPCDQHGNIITGIKHGSNSNKLANGLSMNYSFSNKPPEGYQDFYHKISRYAEIISAPAKFIDSEATERPFNPILDDADDSVFQYFDTNSSRANIDTVNQKLKGQKIAIIGLGGTGSYVLDQVAKTCVSEIHIYDGDVLLNHNAFRSPGTVPLEVLENKPQKVAYYSELYSKLHRHISPHNYYMIEAKYPELLNMDYIFLCIDDNEVRNSCIQFLKRNEKSFIDIGLGVNLVEDSIIGMIRTTTGIPGHVSHLRKRVPASSNLENEYSSNIQVAELNALNAILAVIKWKKLSGFYKDLEKEYHSTYTLSTSMLLNEDCDES